MNEEESEKKWYRYRVWLGLTIWIGGTILAFVVVYTGVVPRRSATYIAAAAFIVPLLWSTYGPR